MRNQIIAASLLVLASTSAQARVALDIQLDALAPAIAEMGNRALLSISRDAKQQLARDLGAQLRRPLADAAADHASKQGGANANGRYQRAAQ